MPKASLPTRSATFPPTDAMPPHMKRGQAMAESVIAIFFIIVAFLLAWDGMWMLHEKLILSHAAQRAARAKCVGLNRFMVEKTARVASITASGEPLLSKIGGERMTLDMELGRIPAYLASETPQEARGILDYGLWDTMSVDGRVSAAKTSMKVSMACPRTEELVRMVPTDGANLHPRMSGEAKIESHFPYYMYDSGR